MLVRGNEVASGSALEFDICIVGAGPAGITLALELESSGKKVAVVESGSTETSKETLDLLNGEVVNHKYRFNSFEYPLTTARDKGFGGSSNRWTQDGGWRARALDAVDFEERAGVPESGWPFDRSHIDPYYTRAHERLGLEPFTRDRESWFKKTGLCGLFINEGDIRTDVFLRIDNKKFIKTYDALCASENITLIIDSNVVDIVTESGADSVDYLAIKTLEQNEFSIKAEQFVLASGGLENPRLLLSANNTHAEGIGNQNDLVGRYFMEHPHIYTGYISMASAAMAGKMNFYTELNPAGTGLLEAVASLDEDVLRENNLPNCGVWIRAISVSGVVKQLLSDLKTFFATRNVPLHMVIDYIKNFSEDVFNILKITAQRILKGSGEKNLFRLYIESEQIPNPESRVLLAEDEDVLGMKKLKLDWQLLEEDFTTIRKTQELMDQSLRKLGYGHLFKWFGDEVPATTIGIGNHQMGTTRMNNDPSKGVVDENSKVHGMKNLFVTGASVFPTSGAANPTMTVVALAIRLADHLKNH